MMTVQRWMRTLCNGSVDAVVQLYHSDAVLVPTFDDRILRGHRAIRDYFNVFMSRPGLCGRIDEVVVQRTEDAQVVSGIYTFWWRNGGPKSIARARYTFVFAPGDDGWQILTQHSSGMPG